MKIRARLLLSLAVVGVTLVGLGLFARPTAAFAPYTVHSLNGTYVGGVVEIRQDTPADPVEYCDEHGTFTFDGSGNGTVDNTRRCTIAGGAPVIFHDVETLTYTVSSTASSCSASAPATAEWGNSPTTAGSDSSRRRSRRPWKGRRSSCGTDR